MSVEMKKFAVKCGQTCLALAVGFVVPVLIIAAAVQGLKHLYQEWRVIRAGLVAGNFVCALDTDCPPGYLCHGGRCVPKAAL